MPSFLQGELSHGFTESKKYDGISMKINAARFSDRVFEVSTLYSWFVESNVTAAKSEDGL